MFGAECCGEKLYRRYCCTSNTSAKGVENDYKEKLEKEMYLRKHFEEIANLEKKHLERKAEDPSHESHSTHSESISDDNSSKEGRVVNARANVLKRVWSEDDECILQEE